MKKKLVRKVLTVVACLIVTSICFVGCGANYTDSQYLGTWTAATAEYSGIEMAASDILGGNIVLTLNDNGKCDADILGDTYTGKWEETDNGFTIDGKMEMTVDGDAGTMEYEGLTLNFEKK